MVALVADVTSSWESGSFVDARGKIGNAGQAQHTQAGRVREKRFRHRGHSNRIRAENSVRPDFGGRFVRRPDRGEINAVLQIHMRFLRGLFGEQTQCFVVDAGLVRKSRSPNRIVRANQGIVADEIDVIVNEHQVAGLEILADSACRIRHDENRRPHLFQQVNRNGDGRPAFAFVPVAATLK